MRAGEPSRTARSAAAYRAAHQVVDPLQLYDDPLALVVLGMTEAEVRVAVQARPAARRMRFFIAARTAYADACALAAIEKGTDQVVVMGAGLDAFAHRHRGVAARVFEVDHPTTQAWKRDRLREAGIATVDRVVYVPVDFETGDLAAALESGGFEADRPAFVLWLGVTPYLTREAALGTLRLVGSTPGNEIVFDYANPPEELDDDRRAERERAMERVARIGEPWQLFFSSEELAQRLHEAGFTDIEDLDPTAIVERFLGIPGYQGGSGAHLVHASREARMPQAGGQGA